MPKASNQKLKILYVMDFFLKESDEEHPITVQQILEELEGRGILCERKSVYDDIETLRGYGLDIVQVGTRRTAAYYVASRTFELAELKLLVDSVQASRFITQRKTASLIEKIETLTSAHEARLLHRQVYVAGSAKSLNESILYNVDAIHSAISRNRKIRFRYFAFTVQKQRKFRRGGGVYLVSPFALIWDNENYYLIAYDADAGFIKHFRVDKMTDIEAAEEERNGLEIYRGLDMSSYTGKVFGMFGGTAVRVRMRFAEHLVGAVLDRLGQEAILVPDEDGQFTVTADVVPSPQFFAWLSGFGPEARILGPEHIVKQMRDHIDSVARLYH